MKVLSSPRLAGYSGSQRLYISIGYVTYLLARSGRDLTRFDVIQATLYLLPQEISQGYDGSFSSVVPKRTKGNG
jgi:hypothetical protein